MTLALIRQALEDALAEVGPDVVTIQRNARGDPPSTESYQIVDLLMAEPGNDEYGDAWSADGVFQVTLADPIGKGPGATERRAQTLIDAFYRGRSLAAGGLAVTISRTPWVMPSRRDDDRFLTPVRITFHARIPPRTP